MTAPDLLITTYARLTGQNEADIKRSLQVLDSKQLKHWIDEANKYILIRKDQDQTAFEAHLALLRNACSEQERSESK